MYQYLLKEELEEEELEEEEDKKVWEQTAREQRLVVQGRGVPIDQVLADQCQCEVDGGPWQMSARCGDSPA